LCTAMQQRTSKPLRESSPCGESGRGARLPGGSAAPGYSAALVLVACLGLAPMASAQEANEDEETDPNIGGGPLLMGPLHPAEWRGFGAGHRSPDDPQGGHLTGHRGNLKYSRNWPAQLIYRPMSPWAGMFDGRAVGEVDLGAGHASSPLRFSGSLAYGLEGDAHWRLIHWGIALDTGKGLCVNSRNARCERWLDQVSADVIYVVESNSDVEWLVKAGLATGPFAPFALSPRVGAAVKRLYDWCALQIEFLAQVPVNQRDTTPTIVALPMQLQIRLQSRVAAYLTASYREVFLPGHNDLTIPAGAGMLLGSRWLDIGAEWRFPRMLGFSRTWDERSLFIILALHYW